jgi:hypothetical protein
MAIVGVFETAIQAGTINTTHSFSSSHNFPAPGLSIWSRPYLQSVAGESVTLNVSKFTDSSGTHTGPFVPGIFASKCTSVTFFMFTDDTVATAVLTTEIFG